MQLKELLNSNREGHLAAAIAAGLGAAYSAHGYQESGLLLTAISIPLWEVLCSCDMDHNSRSVSGSLWRKLWVSYWFLYKEVIPHRSRFSHSLLIGTPFRLLYVSPIIYLLIYAAGGIADGLTEWLLLNWQWIAIAPFIADFVHLLKDSYATKYGVRGILFGRMKRRR